MRLNIFNIILFLSLPYLGFSQDFRNSALNSSIPDSLRTQNEYQLDTTIYDYIYLTHPSRVTTFQDTTLDNFHLYDPIRSENAAYAHLGNMGSEAYPLFYTHNQLPGFRMRPSAFSPYWLNREDLRFFILNRPFSNFFFSPGQSQTDFIFKTQFSRKFKNNLSLSVDYQRINQQGYYTDQNTKSTQLGIGLWKKYDRSDLFFTAIINAQNATQNGGISSYEFFDQDLYNFRERIPTNVTDGQARITNNEYALTHHHYLNDSLFGAWKLTWENTLSYGSKSFKYFDEGLSSDEKTYYQLADTLYTGIRNFTKQKSIHYTTQLRIDKERLFSGKFGISYTHHFVDQEAVSYGINNLIFNSNVSLKFLPISSQFSLGLLDDRGSYNFEAVAKLTNWEWLVTKGMLKLYKNTPYRMYDNLYINQEPVYNNSFDKISGQEINLTLASTHLRTKLELTAQRLQNAIYHSQLYTPIQSEDAITILQAKLTQKSTLWKLNLEHHLYYQRFSDNVYNLPSLYADIDYYFETRLFKNKMLTRFGVNGRVIEPYFTPAYSPVDGIFYARNNLEQEWTTLVDCYISFKIQSFRSFIKFENMGNVIRDDIYFLITDYPQNDFKIRVGVAWQIKD